MSKKFDTDNGIIGYVADIYRSMHRAGVPKWRLVVFTIIGFIALPFRVLYMALHGAWEFFHFKVSQRVLNVLWNINCRREDPFWYIQKYLIREYRATLKVK